jgi:NodT family efflux transporter outer membrane factor (OMF) lipoprotein
MRLSELHQAMTSPHRRAQYIAPHPIGGHKPISRLKRSLLSVMVCAAMAGCAVGPNYQRPDAASPAGYKEAQGWQPAAPADALDRGPWWTLFNDAELNALEAQVEVSNQNVAAAVAAYAQARALVSEQRASLFPVVSLNGGANESGGGGNTTRSSRYQANIGVSWEPDVWGRIGRGITSANAGAAASAADLASARLSAQGELAINYFSLRQTDTQVALLASTIAGYQKTGEITQNRYTAGIVAKTDLLQAQTQLANAQAEALGLGRQRANAEHAIAVLIGKAPAGFSIAPAQWQGTVPEVPTGVPSTLLERRPDIAAAERRVASANEQIGIARSAYYPNLGLNASGGFAASKLGELFSASSSLWSLGLSAAQTLFNAGATKARVSGAQAAHEGAVARYRQTVLNAFQDVEDALAATRILDQQMALRQQASQAADLVEQQILNRYRAGQISFSEVVTAQVTAFNARRALVQLQGDRQTTAVALIQALGGGWNSGQ